MDVKATLETRHSERTGEDYKVVILKLSDKSEKKVFLNRAELELLEMYNQKEKKPSFLK